MAEIWMDEARYFEHGEAQIVQLPGAALRDDNIHYDRLSHKGALKCRFCDAAVHYHTGSKTIGGDNLMGPSAHFHTNPGHKHADDCKWPERAQQAASRNYDKTRGYKIHLNTSGYLDEFNENAGQVYARDENKHIITLKKDLVTREPRSVSNIAGMVGLIEEGNFDRLRDSVVVHRDHVLTWDEFFIRYDRKGEQGQERFADLIRRIKEGGPQPCMIEFNVESGVWPRRFAKTPPVKSSRVDLGRDDEGRPSFVYPRAYVKTANTLVSNAFSKAGRYLVMGYAKLNTYENDPQTNHILSVDLTDPNQVATKSLSSMTAIGRESAARRGISAPA